MSETSFEAVSPTKLKAFIERIERLEEEKADLMENIREVFAEAKALGFDVKIMRQIIKLRKMKKEELAEQEELLTIYMQALGMISADDMGAQEAA